MVVQLSSQIWLFRTKVIICPSPDTLLKLLPWDPELSSCGEKSLLSSILLLQHLPSVDHQQSLQFCLEYVSYTGLLLRQSRGYLFLLYYYYLLLISFSVSRLNFIMFLIQNAIYYQKIFNGKSRKANINLTLMHLPTKLITCNFDTPF